MLALKDIDGLQPIGTRLFEDVTDSKLDTSTYWQPHRNIWEVIAHRECQDYPNAPVHPENEIKLVAVEPLNKDYEEE